MLLATYFFMVIALPLAFGAYVLRAGLPRSRRCPICHRETLLLGSRLYRVAGRVFRGDPLQRRWCPPCDWTGTVRLRGERAPANTARGKVPPRRVAPPRRPPDSVDIRRLDVDGRAVRVMVQCWAEAGEWRGRLLFLELGGRRWVERSFTIQGRSALDVLSQALTLPDGTLVGRLRQVMS